MRATCWTGRNTVQVETVPDPQLLTDRDAIVKISSTAICGSTCTCTTATCRP
jgi:threonine dehydrogenase-like Zn-dependent dehydrogenase